MLNFRNKTTRFRTRVTARDHYLRSTGQLPLPRLPTSDSRCRRYRAIRAPLRLAAISSNRTVSRRLRQVHDSIQPVPRMAIFRPEFRQQPRLLAVVRRPNRAAEQHKTAVTVTRAKHLPCVPRQRCPVKRHEHQTGLSARDQQRGIVQAKPGPVLPPCDVNNGEFLEQTRAGRDESMRRVLVSEQPRRCRFLRHARCGFPRGRPSRTPALASRARAASGNSRPSSLRI